MKYIIAILFFSYFSHCHAQEKNEIILDNEKIYYELDSALNNKEKAFKLMFYSSEGDIFPIKILELVNLRFLYLSGTFIKKIPKEIIALKNLETFICVGCGIEELPSTLGQLKNLKFLDVSDCNLKTLPYSIGKMINLEELNLGGNPITKLPSSVYKLKQLKRFALGDTRPNTKIPLLSIQEELLLKNRFSKGVVVYGRPTE